MTKANRRVLRGPLGYRTRGCRPSPSRMARRSSSLRSGGSRPVAARIIASTRQGSRARPCTCGAASMTRATPLSRSCARRCSLTVVVTMVLPASSCRPRASSSCAAATTTWACATAWRSTCCDHCCSRPAGSRRGPTHSRTWCAPAAYRLSASSEPSSLGTPSCSSGSAKLRFGVHSDSVRASFWCARPEKNSTRALSKCLPSVDWAWRTAHSMNRSASREPSLRLALRAPCRVGSSSAASCRGQPTPMASARAPQYCSSRAAASGLPSVPRRRTRRT